jgi:Tol biopolymer transport system component
VTISNPRSSLWRVPILGDVANESDARPISSLPTPRALAPRFGGGDLFYLSARGADDGLWRVRDGKAEEVWDGTKGALLEPAGISPDGGSVAIVLRRETRRILHIVNADGASVRTRCDAVDVRGSASWSPDGDWIVVGGSDAGGQGLFKVRVEDGRHVRIAGGEALDPVWSPRGDRIVYAGPQEKTLSPLLAVRPDGSPDELPAKIEVLRDGERFRFLPDGSGIVYMQGLKHSQDFWLLDLESDGDRRQLTRLDDVATMRTFDVAPDGKSIVFDRQRSHSDIALIELAGGDRER